MFVYWLYTSQLWRASVVEKQFKLGNGNYECKQSSFNQRKLIGEATTATTHLVFKRQVEMSGYPAIGDITDVNFN